MSVTELPVRGESPYDVVVGHHVLDRVAGLLPDASRVAVVHASGLHELTDSVVAALGDREILRLPLPDGEAAKSAAVAVEAWEALGRAGMTRSDAVVTVGGGATTDMGGFLAATWLRGVKVVHVPTTVLGMVDAAVGGKTGMNTGSGKNLVGAFHEPSGVVCDLDVLDTLPRAELVAGFGEVVKCGFIADPRILDLVQESPGDATDPRSARLRELLERSIQVKIDVVTADLREVGGAAGHPGREVLNYGHTLAHALEAVTGYHLRHGEAVAIGCCFVAELARRIGMLDGEVADRHAAAFSAVGLPVVWRTTPFEALLEVMRVDKKARGALLRLIVLEELARPVVLEGPDESDLRSAYAAIGGPA